MIYSSDKAREATIASVDTVANVVGSTLGPEGRTVIISSKKFPKGIHITKDGVTVASSLILEHPVDRAIASIMREAAEETVRAAGDATTSSIVLTQALIHAFNNHVLDDSNTTRVLRHMREYYNKIISYIQRTSIDVTDEGIKRVASISTNNDNVLGDVISDCYNAVAQSGAITVERGGGLPEKLGETHYTVRHGFEIDATVAHEFFLNNEAKTAWDADDVNVIVYDGEMSSVHDLENCLKGINLHQEPTLIIADYTQQFMGIMATNVAQQGYKLCLVNAPALGWRREEILRDICLATNATYHSHKMGDSARNIMESDVGIAERVRVTKNTITIEPPEMTKEQCKAKADELRQVENADDNDHIQKRIASLDGGLGVIHVGGDTKSEQDELYDRIEDAVLAVKAAIKEGIVPGGGVALRDAATVVAGFKAPDDDAEIARNIIIDACESVFYKILDNAGMREYIPSDDIASLQVGYGLDVINDEWGDMMEMGIIDTTKAVCHSFKSAMSVAITLLNTNSIIFQP